MKKNQAGEKITDQDVIDTIRKNGSFLAHSTRTRHLKLRNKLSEMACKGLIKQQGMSGNYLIYKEVQQ